MKPKPKPPPPRRETIIKRYFDNVTYYTYRKQESVGKAGHRKWAYYIASRNNDHISGIKIRINHSIATDLKEVAKINFDTEDIYLALIEEGKSRMHWVFENGDYQRKRARRPR